jgi:hypothetical protein
MQSFQGIGSQRCVTPPEPIVNDHTRLPLTWCTLSKWLGLVNTFSAWQFTLLSVKKLSNQQTMGYKMQNSPTSRLCSGPKLPDHSAKVHANIKLLARILELKKPDREFNEHMLNTNAMTKVDTNGGNQMCSYKNIIQTTDLMVIELHEAVLINHIQRIEAILDIDMDYATAQDRFGNTAMSLAMKHGKKDIVILLKNRIKQSLGNKCYA